MERTEERDAVVSGLARRLVGGLSISLAGGTLATLYYATQRSPVWQVRRMKRLIKRPFQSKGVLPNRHFHVSMDDQVHKYRSLLHPDVHARLPLIIEGFEGSGKTALLQKALVGQQLSGVHVDCAAFPFQNGLDFMANFYKACGFYTAPKLMRELRLIKQLGSKERRIQDAEAASQYLIQALRCSSFINPPVICIENPDRMAAFLEDEYIHTFFGLCSFLAENKLAQVVFICRPSYSAVLQRRDPTFAQVVRFPDIRETVIRQALCIFFSTHTSPDMQVDLNKYSHVVDTMVGTLGASLSDLQFCLESVEVSMRQTGTHQHTGELLDQSDSRPLFEDVIYKSLASITDAAMQSVEQALRKQLTAVDTDKGTSKLKRLLRFCKALRLLAECGLVRYQQMIRDVFKDKLLDLDELIEDRIFRLVPSFHDETDTDCTLNLWVAAATPATLAAMQRMVESPKFTTIESRCERLLVYRNNLAREKVLNGRVLLHASLQRANAEHLTDEEKVWLHRQSSEVLEELALVRSRRDNLDTAQLKVRLNL